MVNYRYKLDDIEANHERFATGGEVVAAAGVRRLLHPTTASRRVGWLNVGAGRPARMVRAA